jgi:hypothetical protein
MSAYEIKPLDNKYEKNKEPEVMPKHPFCCGLVGAAGFGKTTLMINLVTDPNMLGGKFQRIIILNPTSKSDEKYEVLFSKDVLHSTHADERKISRSDIHTEITKFQDVVDEFRASSAAKSDKHGFKSLKKTLIIFDDVLGLKFMRSSSMIQLVANRRHLNCSIIISLQRLTGIPLTIRNNIDYLVHFPTFNIRELERISEENSSRFDKKEFIAMALKLFGDEEGRHFLVYNQRNPFSHRWIDSWRSFIKKK